MNADPPPPPPPPWVWMVPGSAGLLRLGAGVAPPPVLLASAQPPAGPRLPGLPAWRAPGEPLLPLLPLPAAPDHAAAAAAAHRYPALNGQPSEDRLTQWLHRNGGGCRSSLKPTGSSPTVAIAAAATAVVSVDSAGLGGPSPSRVQPCRLLTLAPIRMPLRTAPFPEQLGSDSSFLYQELTSQAVRQGSKVAKPDSPRGLCGAVRVSHQRNPRLPSQAV
ncbi:hypothetical protein MG293_019261 [Ovis ammon polii]|uniref:Uncharacterized protein n=1 Tax=Ovis ammon polii TaxID=230172 RepID=A0AAD4TLL8_OVIAM|nr:hypothetical protein MG293_019261 [Ovis ammon polii]